MTGSGTVGCEVFVGKGARNAARDYGFSFYNYPVRDAAKECVFS